MKAKIRYADGVWFEREVKGLTIEAFGVPRKASVDGGEVSAEKDALESMHEFAQDDGRALMGVLAKDTAADFEETLPHDLRPVSDERAAEINRLLCEEVVVYSPVVFAVGDVRETAFKSANHSVRANQGASIAETLQIIE